jgi:ubiquinone/menaquinone biosynthesis C-methylase UbiE
MNDHREEAAWTDYWGSSGAAGGGCLPQGLGGIDGPLARLWRETARTLPRGARILDLATGDGIVLRAMQAERPDLKLIGIDSAARLPAAPKGIRLRAGIRMEALPLSDGGIDFATSQFGFEYGESSPIAAELGRVVAAGGGFRFVIHHAGSPIVSHNRSRRAALVWATVESGLLDRARAFARARQHMPLPIPPSFREAVAEARRAFPGQDVAAEFAAAVQQALELGRRSPGETLRALHALDDKARHEVARIDALGEAACGADRIASLREMLQAAGFAPGEPTIIHHDRDLALAWLLAGDKT